jgi:hypothetical protein
VLAHLESSSDHRLYRSGLHTPGITGGAAEEQGEVAGERVQPPEPWLSGSSLKQWNDARVRAPGRANLMYGLSPLPGESETLPMSLNGISGPTAAGRGDVR